MNKFSLLCSLVFASSVSVAEQDNVGVLGSIDIGYKGYKTYEVDEKIGEVAVTGVRGMAYNGLDQNYYSLSNEGLLAFEFDISDSKEVKVSSAKGTAFADTVEAADRLKFGSLVFVENEKDTENAYYIMAADNKLAWYKGAAAAVGADGTDLSGIDSKYTADSDSKLVGVSALQTSDKYYFVYSSQMGLAEDNIQCSDNQCLRISVNTIAVTTGTGDDDGKVSIALTQISQIRYDLEVDTNNADMMGLSDMTLFEDEDGALHAIIVERNDKAYHATLTGNGAKDVSGCDKLSHDDCKALMAVEKTELFTFVSAPTAAPTTAKPTTAKPTSNGGGAANPAVPTKAPTKMPTKVPTPVRRRRRLLEEEEEKEEEKEDAEDTATEAPAAPVHPEGIDELKFEALSIIYRDEDMTLLDADNKMTLVAINNNAADSTKKTHLVFLSWDCSESKLNLKKVAVEDTTSTAEEDEDSAAVSSLPFSYITAVAYCCILAVFSKFIM